MKLNTIKRFIKRKTDRIKRCIPKMISTIIFVLCIMMFILAMFCNVAHRAPILSFLAREMHLPYEYTLTGEIIIKNIKEKEKIPVRISVGGFSTDTNSGEHFQLHFVSVDSSRIPVTITYETETGKVTAIEYIDYSESFKEDIHQEYCIGE